MRKPYTLRPTNPVQVVDLDFRAVAIAVSNPTSSPVHLRLGAPDTPSATNADVTIPAATSSTFPITGAGYAYCAAFGSPTSIATPGSATLSGLLDECVITFLSEGEPIPTYGEYSFLNLSVSPLTNGAVAYSAVASVSPTFDLLPWGGAIAYILPGAGTGQGTVIVQNSDDATTWRTQFQVTLWPAVPLTLSVARIARYMRLLFGGSPIVGEPPIGGSYIVRASLEEIQQTSWSAGIGSIQKAYSVPNLSSQSFYFVTVGLRAVALKLVNTTGSRLQMVWYTSPDLSTWSLVAYREQFATGFYNSIFRSIGQIDTFLRVDILEIGNGGALNGILNLIIQDEPDITGVLQNMYAALGDAGGGANANQDIYHELDTMRQRLALLAEQATLSSINTGINSINTDIDVALSTRASESSLAGFRSDQNASANISANSGTISSFGAMVNYGAFLPNNVRAYRIIFTWAYTANPASSMRRITLNIGNAVGPNNGFGSFYIPTERVWDSFLSEYVVTPQRAGYIILEYDGTMSGGQSLSTNTFLWIQADDANTTSMAFAFTLMWR